MGLGKSLKKYAKVAVDPINAGLSKLSGVKQTDLYKIGAGVGSVAGAVSQLKGKNQVSGYADTSLGSGQTSVGSDIARSSDAFKPNYLASFGPSMIGLAGDIYSARTLASGQEAANQASMQSAREQMQFQERMSSTAHQREVRDLEAAGLNPVLSANSGASSPSGESITFENEAPNYRGAISHAIEAAQKGADINESMSRAQLNKVLAWVQGANQEQALASADQLRQYKELTRVRTETMKISLEWLKEHKWTLSADKYMEYATELIGAGKDLAVSKYFGGQ